MAERPARTKDSEVAGVTADHAANSERHHRHTLLEVSWLLWTCNQLVCEGSKPARGTPAIIAQCSEGCHGSKLKLGIIIRLIIFLPAQ